MFFQAIFSKSGKVAKLNLDTFAEMQEEAAARIEAGFINLEVKAFNSNGLFKLCEYVEELGVWEKVRETKYN